MSRPLGISALAAALLLICSAGAGAQARRIAFRALDAQGHRIDSRAWRSRRTVVVTFTSRDAQDATRRLLTRIDEATLSDDSLETVLIADVAAFRSFPTRGFAESALTDGLRDALAARRTRRETAGIPTRTAGRFHLVPDWTGELLAAFRVPGIGAEPVTLVLDRRGVYRGSIRGSDTIASRRILAAIAAARPRPRPAAPAIASR